MKTSFKPANGRVYHVIHETKSLNAPHACWSLCGNYFHDGDRFDRVPTCPRCLANDNPLALSTGAVTWLKSYMERGDTFVNLPSLCQELFRADFIDAYKSLTRRGQVLALDWTQGAVPFADKDHVVHERWPLGHARCCRDLPLEGWESMTFQRYERLRLVHENTPFLVTCLTCLART